jgi:hypothetical protein
MHLNMHYLYAVKSKQSTIYLCSLNCSFLFIFWKLQLILVMPGFQNRSYFHFVLIVNRNRLTSNPGVDLNFAPNSESCLLGMPGVPAVCRHEPTQHDTPALFGTAASSATQPPPQNPAASGSVPPASSDQNPLPSPREPAGKEGSATGSGWAAASVGATTTAPPPTGTPATPPVPPLPAAAAASSSTGTRRTRRCARSSGPASPPPPASSCSAAATPVRLPPCLPSVARCCDSPTGTVTTTAFAMLRRPS